jgi:uncharacterized protein DUF5681
MGRGRKLVIKTTTVEKQRDNNGKFAKGNTHGFTKGKSGNPAGRPRGTKYLSEALRVKLASLSGADDKLTCADTIADVIVENAMKGNMDAIHLIFTRTEGEEAGKYPFGADSDYFHTERNIYRRMIDQQIDYDTAVDELVEEAMELMKDREEAERERIREEAAELKRQERERLKSQVEVTALAIVDKEKAEQIAREAIDKVKKLEAQIAGEKSKPALAPVGHDEKPRLQTVTFANDPQWRPIPAQSAQPEPEPEREPWPGQQSDPWEAWQKERKHR